MNTQNTLSFVGRLLLATIFLLSGVGKVLAAQGTVAYIASVGLPLPHVSYFGAVLVELGGGLLLAVGYHARIAAAALAVFSVVTALIFHNALGDQNQLFHFLKDLAIAGGLLQVAAFGAGSFSLDARSPIVALERR